MQSLPITFFGTNTNKIFDVDTSIGLVSFIKCMKSNYFTYNIIPDDEFLKNYYNTIYTDKNKSWYNITNSYNDCYQLNRNVEAIKRLANIYILDASCRDEYSTVTVHDIGCGFGGLTSSLRAAGFNAYGTDSNAAAVAEGQTYGNDHIYCTDIEAFPPPRSRSIIISNHVIEHIPDPVTFMSKVHTIMADISVARFTFPNGCSYPALIGRHDLHGWIAYPDHLHLFGPYSIFMLLHMTGFTVLEISSHRYYQDHNKKNIIKAICPLSLNTVYDYDAWQEALERNFCAAELQVVFCRNDSSIVARHNDSMIRSLNMFSFFENAGM
jgi:SAM-dependent methyltransferase